MNSVAVAAVAAEDAKARQIFAIAARAGADFWPLSASRAVCRLIESAAATADDNAGFSQRQHAAA